MIPIIEATSLLIQQATTSGYVLAYIGPGAGIGAIILTIALAFGVLYLFFGLIWFPLKRALRKKKSSDAAGGNSSTIE